ncbi:MAG: hypothetical protein IJC32_03315 [Clostridia bacterium]|nr:hypothetical protein [Clostridia bacterium]
MKKYDNFNYSFFLTVICVIATLALVFAVAVVTIGVFFSADSTDSEIFEDHVEIPSGTDTPDTLDTEPVQSTPDTQVPDTEPPETQAPDTEPPETQLPNTPNEPTPTLLGESEDMGQEYIDKFVFLVDATNVGLRSYGVLSGGKNTDQVWRTTNGTLTLSGICEKKIIYPESGVEMTVADAAAKAKPEYLVIALGFEGMNQLSSEKFIEEYTALINALKAASPDTLIILQSVYPIASRVKGKVTNEKINELNSVIYSLAQSCDVKYLDTCTALKDENGAMKEEYDNGGTGWNLNAKGFETVLSYIRTHAYK